MEDLILNGLNEQQCKVVKELDSNILLLASAGTGKTNTLSRRIENIIKNKKSKSEEILCMTFTNRACKEMKDRIVHMLGKDAIYITVKTFHGFCFDVIKNEAKKNTDINFDFMVYDEEDSKEIINEYNIESFNVSSLYNFISYIKETSVARSYKDYRELIKNSFSYSFNKLKEICVDSNYKTDYKMLDYLKQNGEALVNAYDSTLKERHGMDFNDLTIKVNDLFSEEKIAKIWRSKFKYIFVDEVQDTSMVEYEIISKLFYENNVMICGDYFQTIYEWRGSEPSKILEDFSVRFSPVKIVFNENYRSTQTLLKASYGYLKNSFTGEIDRLYENDIEPKSNELGKKIILKQSEDLIEEGRWIFNKIRELKVKDVSRIAILTRNNKLNNELSQIFLGLNSQLPKDDKINFLLVDQFKFFKRQEIKDIVAYLKLILNKLDNNSLKRILKRFANGVGERTIESIKNEELLDLGVRLTDLIDINTHKYGEPYQLLINELHKGNVVIFDVESTGINTTEDEIVQISAVKVNFQGQVLDKFERFVKSEKSVGKSELVHGFSDEFLKINGENPKKALGDFLKFAHESLIVGHNVTYDISILESQLSRLGMEKLKFIDYYDTLDIARRFYINLKNHKLETLSGVFNTETKSSHNAMDDVLATKDVLLAMLKEKVIPTAMNRITIYGKYLSKFTSICRDIYRLRGLSYSLRPCDLIAEVVKLSNIKEIYSKEPSRVNNVREMYLICKDMDELKLSTRDCLMEFLSICSLSNSELDRMLKKHPRIPIITIHQSKGSEFDYVFISGLEDCIFPSYKSIKDGNLEEEKRIFYVGLTRAKKQVFLTFAKKQGNKIRQESRLIEYLPNEYIERI